MKFPHLLIVICVFLSGFSHASQDGVGLGIVVGAPTGLTFKKWLSPSSAIDAAAAWSTSNDERYYAHMDYLIHDSSLFKKGQTSGQFEMYYGLGGLVSIRENDKDDSDDDTVGAIRVPVGISFQLKTNPIEFFAEIVPILEVSPDSEFGVDAGLGARYYF